MTIKFFKSPADFRKWLQKYHASTQEQWVGFYKKGSGQPSTTWPESVDQALCFGWIDGIRKSIDDVSYKIRMGCGFTLTHLRHQDPEPALETTCGIVFRSRRSATSRIQLCAGNWGGSSRIGSRRFGMPS